MLELSELKQELLSRCIQPPVFESQEARQDVTEIYSQVKQSLARPQNAAENIIYEFYRELRDNPQAVRKAVSSYNFAFAATAQQSDRAEIKVAKNVENPRDEKSHAEYETVIVDEAARITLGDLMIPLSWVMPICSAAKFLPASLKSACLPCIIFINFAKAKGA